MIQFGSIYLIVKDFAKSIEFYKALLEKDVDAQNMTRFAIFNVNGLCLSIMNGYFDVQNPDKVDTKGNHYDQYDDMVAIAEKANCGKVVINLSTDDLEKEYQRILSLGIGENITPIRYISAGMPYYYFSMKDPDGNTIEITGPYEEKDGEFHAN